jgi:hypothetical protein
MIKGCKPFKDEPRQRTFDDEFDWDANRRSDDMWTLIMAGIMLAAIFCGIYLAAGGL